MSLATHATCILQLRLLPPKVGPTATPQFCPFVVAHRIKTPKPGEHGAISAEIHLTQAVCGMYTRVDHVSSKHRGVDQGCVRTWPGS
jgi:hypothetical protein